MKRFVYCGSKKNRAYRIVTTFIIVLLVENLSAQNVGIGITSPTRAKLETRGMVGNTLALFGSDQHGIGLVTNNPGVYFNSYSNGGTRVIQPGQGGLLTFDPSNGRFQFARTATGTMPDQFVTQSPLASIESNGDIIANSYRFSPVKTFFYSLTGADFTARYGEEIVIKEVSSGGATMNNGDGFQGMVAPVHLPHGATVTSITFYYTDNSGTTDLIMTLQKYNPITSIYFTMTTVTSSGTPGATNGTTNIIATPVIDNTSNALSVLVNTNLITWPNTIIIRAVVIAYTVAEAG